MLNIAITGGIGAGKSTVTDHLISLGYTVIDADKMSRDITSAGGKAIPYILRNFGPDYVNPDGSLNRAAMRDLVFREPRYKAVLEEGTTKVVIEDIEKNRAEKEAAGEKVLFYDIPLLFEKHLEKDYDSVWVVTADREIRKERVMKRDNIEEGIIDLIIGSQEDEEIKTAGADVVFYNNGSVRDLLQTVSKRLSEL